MKKIQRCLLLSVLLPCVSLLAQGEASAQSGNAGTRLNGRGISDLPLQAALPTQQPSRYEYQHENGQGFQREYQNEYQNQYQDGYQNQYQDEYQRGYQQAADDLSRQAFDDGTVTDERSYPEVKNVNFFGIDRESCCDEWKGLCKCKSTNYACKCGGLKMNKGHLGIWWLKSKYGGEDCDFCNGGCCEKGCRGKCGESGDREKKRGSLFNLDSKRSCKCSECSEGPSQSSIFSRSNGENCQKNDRRKSRRDGGCDGSCPDDQGCQSCQRFR